MVPTTNGSGPKGKIVVCRDMGEEAMGILQESGYEVSRGHCEGSLY
jgi:predicted Fe-Mo cluster-binding NifX family protein